MSLAGLDIGSTGCKCSIYYEEGALLDESYHEYPKSSRASANEVDPTAVWSCVKQSIADVSASAKNLKAIGITSFGESVVFADADGNPLMPSMLYTDPRGDEQCARLCENIGEKELGRITGVKPHCMYSIAKIMWVKENRPEIYGRVRHLFQFEDYIAFMLCGKAQIDYSLAARTMAFDIRKLDWSSEVLDLAGVNRELLSKVAPTGSIAGDIRPELAGEFGLSLGIKIVSGCHDQVAATIGCGVTEPGYAVDGTGTVECITPVKEKA